MNQSIIRVSFMKISVPHKGEVGIKEQETIKNAFFSILF